MSRLTGLCTGLAGLGTGLAGLGTGLAGLGSGLASGRPSNDNCCKLAPERGCGARDRGRTLRANWDVSLDGGFVNGKLPANTEEQRLKTCEFLLDGGNS